MADDAVRVARTGIHPLHAFLLAASVPLFLGALLSDITYSRSYQIQWSNFAAWLLPAALVFAGFALLWALIDLLRADRHWSGRPLLYFLVLLAAWIIGFIDALVHAEDAWGKMPQALILSLIATVLACAAAWLGFSMWRAGDVK